MIVFSSLLRKEDDPVSKEKGREVSEKVNKTFHTENKEGIVVNLEDTPEDLEKTKNIKTAETYASEDNATTDKNLNSTHTTSSSDYEPDKIEIVIQGTNYSFWFSWVNNGYADGIKLSFRNEASNEYELSVNYGLPYFGEGAKTKKELELIQKMAVTIAASIITARKNGDKDAYRTLNIINSILKGTK